MSKGNPRSDRHLQAVPWIVRSWQSMREGNQGRVKAKFLAWPMLAAIAISLAAHAAGVSFTSPLTNTATVTPPAGITTTSSACTGAGGTYNSTTGACSSSDSDEIGWNATISKTGPTPVILGVPFNYTVGLGNAAKTISGANTTSTIPSGTSLTITEAVPAGLTINSVTASTGASAVSCAGTTFPVAGAGTFNCTVTTSVALPSNTAATSNTVAVLINATTTTVASITNSASVDPTGGTNPPSTTSCTPITSCSSATSNGGTTLQLAKTWVTGISGDKITVTTTGGTNNPTLTSTSTGGAGQTGSPSGTATVFSGNAITLPAETFSTGLQANYTTTVTCNNKVAPLTNATLPATFTVAPTDANLVCTYTNTRKSATLTVAKTWAAKSAAGDTTTVTTSGFINNASSGSSVATVAGNTTTGSSVIVYAGESGTLGESNFTNIGNYVQSYSCTGGGTITGTGALSFTSADAGKTIACVETNTRKSATLTVAKTWAAKSIAGDTTTVTTSGFFNTASSGSSIATAAGNTTTGATAVTVYVGESGTLSESNFANIADYAQSYTCAGGGTITTAGALSISAADSGTTITCTETNTRKTATLSVAKTWAPGSVAGNATTVSTSGFINTATSGTSTATAGGNTTTGTAVTVYAGESGTLSESNFANIANYTQSYACAGGGTISSAGALSFGSTDAGKTITCTETNTNSLVDMTSAISGLPTSQAPGSTVSGTLTCTNSATSNTAIQATCTAGTTTTGATVTVGTCTPPAPAATLAGGSSIVCPISVTAPGTAGGTDTTATSVVVNGATSATNETVTNNNTSTASVNIIDAVNDTFTGIGSVAGGSTTSVLANDQNGASTATTTNVTLTGGTQGCTPATTGATCSTLTLNADGTITVPANATPGTYTYGYQICANPATNPVSCDTATATITVANTLVDMTSAISGLPTSQAPGSTVSGTLTCTNSAASATATQASCTATTPTGGATVTVGTCTPPAPAATLAGGSSIVCPISVTAPGTAGGTDTTATSVVVNGATSATNETVTNNNTSTASVNIIDAVNDTFTGIGSVAGGSTTSVLANDQNGASTATTTNVTLTGGTQGCTPATTGATCSTLTLNADGTITVPANATPGTYTYGYQICANPATNPASCDTATATITVANTLVDMTSAISGLPTSQAPGSTVSGTLTCTNSAASATATQASCTATTPTGGATVTVGTCTPPAPAATLAGGSSIVCPISVTAPGTAGGTDTTATSVVVNGATSATNETVTNNNTSTASVNIIDAVNDTFTGIGSVAGGSTTSVLANDQNGTSTATTTNITLTGGTQGCTPATTGATCSTLTLNADGTITVPAHATPGTYTYGYQICANPATNPASCDTATATITVTNTLVDMTSAISGLPTSQAPGSTVSGTLTCTNSAASATATQATCTATTPTAGATVTVGTCTPPAPAATLAGGSSIVCPISVTAPGTAGGSDTSVTAVQVTGNTSATNETTTNNNTSTASVNLIDAVDDSFGGIGSTAGGTTATSVLANDQNGAAAATTANVTLTAGTQACTPATTGATCSTLTLNADGTITVPANATPGTYTYGYQICANPATNPASCDTATATITVANTLVDMTSAISGLPTSQAPGSTVSGTLTCTNSAASATATQASCTATTPTGGATVTVGTCTPPAPAATLAGGSSIVCPISVTAPGTAGGTDTTATSVVVNGATSATNETVTNNNTSTASVNIIDAVNDTFTGIGSVAGGSTTSVLANDQNGTSTATTTNITLTGGTQGCTPATTGATCSTLTLNADGTITVPAHATPGTYTYGYQICANPATNPASCDTATATITVTNTLVDMTSAISGLPTSQAPGSTVSGTLTCTNSAASATATQATCTATTPTAGATVTVGTCTPPAPAATLAGGSSIVCPISVTAPGTAGGSDTSVTAVQVTGNTSATNETTTNNNTSTASVNLIDAVDDSFGGIGSTAGGTTATSVLANDQNGAAAATTANVTLTAGTQACTPATTGATCSTLTLNADGTITVPANATPGTYTYGYQICANPATNPASCDTATATITVANTLVDMTSAISGLPTSQAPGSTVSGTLTCTNSAASATATQASCTATTPTGGATVTVGTCTPPAPAATLAGGSSIVCPISVTAPGTAGGTDTTATSVVVNGATSATNETVTNNNTSTASVNIIDAVNDTFTGIGSVAGGSTTSVLANDQNGTSTATTTNVTLTGGTQGCTPATTGATCSTLTLNADGTITVPAHATPGTYTYGYQICANPATNPASCDTATATIAVNDTTTTLSATLSNVPAVLSPGQKVTGVTLTCTNTGTTNAALNTTCAPSTTAGAGTGATAGSIANLTCNPASPDASLAPNSSIVCTFDYTAPGTAGGADEPTQTDILSGTSTSTSAPTSATATPVTVPLIDAVNDGPTQVGSVTGGTTPSVLANDTVGTATATASGGTPNVTLTPGTPSNAGLSMNATTGVITVAAGTAPGTYAYPYTICSTIVTTTCDSATATVTVNDTTTTLSATLSNVPAVLSPGQKVTGVTLTCTNTGTTNAALNTTCAPSTTAGAGTGATAGTIANLTCNPASPDASLAPNSSIVCTFDYTAPGTAGGADEPTQTDILSGTSTSTSAPTSATATPVTVPIIDAVNDGPTQVGSVTGGTTPSVLANDTVGTATATASGGTPNVTLTPGTPSNAGLSMNATTGVITVAAGTAPGTYAYPYTICSKLVTTTCDSATATVTVNDTTTTLSATLSNVPAVLSPGQKVTGVTLTCTNTGTTNAALNTTCAPSTTAGAGTGATAGTIANLTCNPASPDASLAPNSSIVCTFDYTAPGTVGGADEPTQTDILSGTSTSSSAATATATPVTVPIIDAVNDTLSTGSVTGGTTTSVLANDSLGSATAVATGGAANVKLTPGTPPTTSSGSLTMAADGTIVVAPNTTPGMYNYSYTICSTVVTTTCDTAIATVTVNDTTTTLTATLSNVPAVLSPGQKVTGITLTCTNTGTTNAALNTTCAPSTTAGAGTGATAGTIANLTCNPASPDASLAPNSSIVCTFDYTAPGTAGGADEPTQTDILSGTSTSSSAATATATPVTVPIIDAVNDGPTQVGSVTGGTTPSVLANDTVGNATASASGATPNVTLTPGASPNPGLSMNATTGVITVAAGTAPATYSYPYTICSEQVTTTCDTATATVTVIDTTTMLSASLSNVPAVLSPGQTATGVTLTCTNNSTTNPALNTTCAPSTTEGAGNGATAGTIANLVCNPTSPDASLAPNSSIVCTFDYTAPGTAGGADEPTQTDILSGTSTSTSAPTSATATPVTVPIIDAVNDGPTQVGSVTGGTTPSVLANDTVGTATATASGGTPNVTLTPGTPSNAGLSMNATTGVITVAAGTAPGTYSYPYTICSKLVTTTCDTATATVVVSDTTTTLSASLSNVPAALSPGQTVTGITLTCTNTGTNSALNTACAPSATAGAGNGATAGTISNLTCNPSSPDAALAPSSSIVCTFSYTAPGSAGGADEPTQTDILSGTATSTSAPTSATAAPVAVPIVDAVNDGPTQIGSVTGGTVPSVLGNDTLGTAAATTSNITLTPGTPTTPAAGSLTMNSDGSISVAAGTTPGTYTYPYTICAQSAPTACDTATATITVNDTTTSLSATVSNVPSVLSPGETATGVTLTCTNTGSNTALSANCIPSAGAGMGAGATAGTLGPISCAVGGTPVTLPTVLAAGQSIVCTYNYTAPGTAGGNDEPTQTDLLGGTASSISTPTPVTAPVQTVAIIDAVDDGPIQVGSVTGGTTTSVLINDTVGTAPASASGTPNVTLTPGTPSNTGLTMNATTGVITIAAGTAPGTYTYPYTICSTVVATSCDTATATVTVSDTTTSLSATVSNVPAAVSPGDTVTGVTLTCTNTGTNPALNTTCAPNVSAGAGTGATPGTISNLLCTPTSPDATLAPNSSIACTFDYTAPGTPGGNDEPTQTDLLGGTSTSESAPTPATATPVTLPIIDAVDDNLSAGSVSGGTTASVLGNDTLGVAGATSSGGTPNVTLTPGAAPTTASGGLTMNADGTITVAPNTTPGTYSYPYTICAISAPTVCDTATATVVVDNTTTTLSATVGGLPTALSPGETVTGATLTCTNTGSNVAIGANCVPTANAGTLGTPTCTEAGEPVTLPTDLPGGASIVCTFSYTAPGTPGGSDDPTTTVNLGGTATSTSAPTPATAPTVTLPIIDALDDGPLSAGSVAGGTTPSVLINDTVGNTPATATGTTPNVTLIPGTSPDSGLTMNPDGTITVAPGTTPGTYAYPYQICVSPASKPAACDTATATVTVSNTGAVTAVPDNADTPYNTAVIINVTGNDSSSGGTINPASLTITTPPAHGTVVCDSLGNCTYTPNQGFAGTDTFVYNVCDNSGPPPNCGSATVTVGVGPQANNDTASTTHGTPVSGNVGTNDVYPPGSTFSVIVQPPNGTVTMTPNGGYIYTPNGNFSGTDTFTYSVCEPAPNASLCSTATVTVSVGAGPTLFDPPFISKAASVVDTQTLLWTIVIDNYQNALAQNVQVRDPLPAGMNFVSGQVTCESFGGSTVSSCSFDAASNSIIANALLQSDLGSTSQATAPNRVVITFQAKYTSTPVKVTNIASACWDVNNSATNISACTTAIQGSATYTPQTTAPLAPLPINSRWMLMLLSMMFGVFGALVAVRRKPAERRQTATRQD